jgi:hypothetical protein
MSQTLWVTSKSQETGFALRVSRKEQSPADPGKSNFWLLELYNNKIHVVLNKYACGNLLQ